MFIKKYAVAASLSLAVLSAAFSSPSVAREPDKRSERTERAKQERPAETPYSNRSQAREREARREAKAVEQDRQPGYYRFEDRRRRPEQR